jgi:hypothetical protein
MASYTKDQKVLLIKTLLLFWWIVCCCGDTTLPREFLSCCIIEGQYLRKFLNSLKKRKCLCDKCTKGRQCSASSSTEEAWEGRNNKSSCATFSTTDYSLTQYYEYMDDLSLFPYKMRLSATVGRRNSELLCFCEEYGALLEDNPGVLNTIWFPDEVHLYLGGYTAHSNTRVIRIVKVL